MASTPPRSPGLPNLPTAPRSRVAGRPYSPPVHPPLAPLALIIGACLIAVALVAVARGQNAGANATLSMAAFGAWLVGSVLGLIGFAWFRDEHLKRQLGSTYSEPAWRPVLLARVGAIAAWVVGCAGAYMIAEAVARR